MIVVGAGNDLRRDDGAGLAAARQLRAKGLDARELRGDLSGLVDAWTCADRVFIVDAARTGAAPGTVHRFDATAASLPLRFSRGSTHAMGVADGVELARALGRMPRSLVVFGIEGSDFTHGEGFSPAVARAVGQVASMILQEATRE